MPCTVEADELTKMNEEGKIPGCIVDGPLSLDLAIEPEQLTTKVLLIERLLVMLMYYYSLTFMQETLHTKL